MPILLYPSPEPRKNECLEHSDTQLNLGTPRYCYCGYVSCFSSFLTNSLHRVVHPYIKTKCHAHRSSFKSQADDYPFVARRHTTSRNYR